MGRKKEKRQPGQDVCEVRSILYLISAFHFCPFTCQLNTHSLFEISLTNVNSGFGILQVCVCVKEEVLFTNATSWIHFNPFPCQLHAPLLLLKIPLKNISLFSMSCKYVWKRKFESMNVIKDSNFPLETYLHDIEKRQ